MSRHERRSLPSFLLFCNGVIAGVGGGGNATLFASLATLLATLANDVKILTTAQGNAEGGTKNFRFGTRRSHSVLNEYLRIAKGVNRPRDGFFLRAESFFNVATEIENLDAEPSFGPPIINSYGGRSLHEQSHGESFLALMLERFGGQGVYILDEPEAALSPQRQLAVLSRMHDLVLDHSQFIVATHSPILMAYPDAWIYRCDAEGLSQVAYQDTDHFRVTRDFLASPERMLRVLLKR